METARRKARTPPTGQDALVEFRELGRLGDCAKTSASPDFSPMEGRF
jgi:hypothetical protein